MSRQASPGKWSDRNFVRVWDSQPTNPLKAEQLDILAAVIRENWRRGSRILDLGCGTGKAEELILERLPVARFVCADRSDVMLDFARERLALHARQCRFVRLDIGSPELPKLRERPFRFILLVDVVHELTDPAKRRLFRYCRTSLTRDGLLLILDRIAVDLKHLKKAHSAVLHRLQQVTRTKTGQLSDCFADARQPDHEHPPALEPNLRVLRTSGFAPAVLHLHFHKALLTARPV